MQVGNNEDNGITDASFSKKHWRALRKQRKEKEASEYAKAHLYNRGVSLVFLREPQINSATYRHALTNGVPLTGTNVDYILAGVNQYLMVLAKEQIRLAFGQAEKEVTDLRQRTREGIETARLNGKQVGQRRGAKLNVKKAAAMKPVIFRHAKDFGGSLKDAEVIQLTGLARNTYYKYKRELKADVYAG